MKLAKSATFNPEKMLSVVITLSLIQLNGKLSLCPMVSGLTFFSSNTAYIHSSPLELRRTLLQKRLRSLLFVFGPGAKPKEGGLQREALGLAGFQSFVHRLK